jgi:hypothetical protein
MRSSEGPVRPASSIISRGMRLYPIWRTKASRARILPVDLGPSRPGSLEPAAGETIAYLQHLHLYVYELKHEAEARARALVTVTGLYVAASAFVVKTAEGISSPHHAAAEVLKTIVVVFGFAGAALAAVSLLQAMLVFRPQVIDATSPMEPLKIVATPIDELVDRHLSYSQIDIVSSLCREIQAVATLQISRSEKVAHSATTFLLAILCLVTSIVLLAVCFVAF